MSEPPAFAEFLARIRAGDARAAEELVRRYESAIRLAVRTRLTDPTLKRRFDSVDVCQSVLASFFVRAAAGQYDLDSPGQLVRLLEAMARHKLLRQVGRLRAGCRGGGRCPGGDTEVPDPGPDPPGVGRARVAAAAPEHPVRRPGPAARPRVRARAAGPTTEHRGRRAVKRIFFTWARFFWGGLFGRRPDSGLVL